MYFIQYSSTIHTQKSKCLEERVRRASGDALDVLLKLSITSFSGFTHTLELIHIAGHFHFVSSVEPYLAGWIDRRTQSHIYIYTRLSYISLYKTLPYKTGPNQTHHNTSLYKTGQTNHVISIYKPNSPSLFVSYLQVGPALDTFRDPYARKKAFNAHFSDSVARTGQLGQGTYTVG